MNKQKHIPSEDWDDFTKRMRKREKDHPILCGIEISYYWCLRNLNPKDYYKEIKWKLQRTFRGYNDRDLWSIKDYFNETILKSLKAFKKMDRFGYPVYLTEEKENQKQGEEKWEKILDDMIEGLEYMTTEPFETEIYKKYEKKEITDEEYKKQSELLYKEAEEKAKLFITHLNHLWD